MSIPLSYEDETNNEEEGMVGKILNVARTHHKESQKEIQDAKTKIIDAFEEKVGEIQEMISES